MPSGHMSDDQAITIGRRLLQAKASLTHGHFGPWLDKQQGLSRSMAMQCMALARGKRREYGQRGHSQAPGGARRFAA